MMKDLEFQRKPKDRDMTIHQKDNYKQFIDVMYDDYYLKTSDIIEKEKIEKIRQQEESLKKIEKLREEKEKEIYFDIMKKLAKERK